MNSSRLQILVVLGVTIAWQIYVVIAAASHAATFQQLFSSLGAELPVMTRLFFITCRWWFVVPLLFAILLADCARRPDAGRWYVAILTGASLAAGFAMQAWAIEACFTPMFTLIKQIG